MYLETFLKAKFGVCTELWLIVKRWYPVLTESFDIVCNDDCEFQNRTSQACSGQNICIFETTRGTTYDCVMPLSKGGRVICTSAKPGKALWLYGSCIVL